MLEELIEQIRKYLDRDISLSDLEDWVNARLPRLILDPFTREASLEAAIELSLAEYNDKLRDEDSIRSYLDQELHSQTIYKSFPQETFQTTKAISTSTLIKRELILDDFSVPVQVASW